MKNLLIEVKELIERYGFSSVLAALLVLADTESVYVATDNTESPIQTFHA